MNMVHFHLLLNHFPIIGTLIGVCLLGWGIIKKQDILRFTGALLIAVMALITLPVNKSGEEAEETVEHIQGVSEVMLEEHEEAAETAMFVMIVTGIVAVGSLVLDKRSHSKASLAYITTFVLSLITCALMMQVGYYGGQIRRPDLHGAQPMQSQEKEHH
jgi:uncharacterized membrane protein